MGGADGSEGAAPVRRNSSDAPLEAKLADIQQVKRYAKYLHAHIKLREAVQMDKRVNYFKGNKLYEACLAPGTDKNKPPCSTEEDCKQLGIALLQFGLIHASEIANKQRRELRPVRTTTFSEDGFYTWIYEGSKTMRNVMLGALVTAIAAMCLFPIWPQSAKVGIWYVSVTLLLFLFVLFTVRLILYLVFWSIGYEFWILPNFFDEDLGVADSFRPLVSFEKGDDLQDSWYFRAAGLVGLIAFGYWCSQQPTDFDELYASQMEFLSELYDGKLLQDPAKEEEIMERAIPNVDDLEKEIEQEEMGIDPDDEEEAELARMVEEAEAAEAAAEANEEDEEEMDI